MRDYYTLAILEKTNFVKHALLYVQIGQAIALAVKTVFKFLTITVVL